MKKIKIALLGLGTVGRGVWMILNSNKEEIRKRAGYEVEVSKILVRNKNKKRGVDVPDNLITTDYNDILNDDSIKIVIEVMGGMNPAKEYILKAMKNKKHVVTANKMLLATDGDELFKMSNNMGVMLKYEASVAGGIPIIKGIDESLTANKIEKLYGIVNGTTNYILSKMELEGSSFENALKEAQDKGYAEADPTSDVEGYDAQYKLAILASLAFGTKIDLEKVYREGITKIESVDMQYAKEFKMGIKLLAIAKETDGKIELRVHPTMVPKKHPLSNIYDSFNAVFINGNAVGDVMFYGRGAGDLPTGSAVVSDIVSIIRSGIQNEVSEVNNNLWDREILPMKDVKSKFYLRVSVKDEPGVLSDITSVLGKNNVSIRSVIQKGEENEDGNVTIVIVTHMTTEGEFKKAMKQIGDLKNVVEIENMIRIEDFK
ncbi:homoserine dehydrogenase [Clostridium sp. BJN0001]|uniref:homoserine dehydrogenase n=1 Tax=Clostridium sp. BJN0001 TaxID=2930219 RepID=UPI001FD61F26|nr:homoserine dehydrogenase [Clostridium sp. BJN0001]